MADTTPLPWKTAWIVGGSSGLGRELAKLLDGRVPAVAVSARSGEALKELEAQSKTIKAYPLDITDREAVSKTLRAIETAHGPVDLVVLSAGIWKIAGPSDFDADDFEQSMEVNYGGVINVLADILPDMLNRRAGQIAIISSVAGYRGLPKSAAYAPTKAALINLAESLHPELAEQGITLSIVNPGFVDTPMTETNDFPMPFLMPVDEAAERLLRGLKRKDYEIVFPRRMALAMKALRLMPNALFFWIVRTFMLKSEETD
jgi:short-subunit dehydrogenase